MKHRTRFIRLFWISLAVLGIGVTVLGGCVAWKLIHSATPKIERSHADPEQMLERTVAARQEETSDATAADADSELKTDISTGAQTGTKTESTIFSQDDEEDQFWEDDDDYYDDEDDDFEDEYEEDNGDDASSGKSGKEFSYALEDEPAPTPAPRPAAKAKVAPKRSAPKIIYASYNQGLLQCQKGPSMPCSWKDDKGPLIKQYWLRSYQGPIERIMYTRDGKIVSQTFAGLDGTVTRYQGSFAELYFENGLLTKIRTFPYDNPNLRDWFLIDKKGKISACLCGIPTKDCCSRSSLYREGGPRRYCDLFPLDADFCSK